MKEINQTDLGPLNPAATGSFDAPPNPDQFEKRKKYFVPAMMKHYIELNSKIEKILNLNRKGEYAVGDKLTLADLHLLFCKQFCFDKDINQYADFQDALVQSAPTLMKITQKVEEEPEIKKYLESVKHMSMTGFRFLW